MDWKNIVATVAPWIGTALGGPLGGMAVEAAASALGLSDKTVDGLKAAVSGMTPEQALSLKSADQAFALRMQELGYKNVADLEAIAAADRHSARGMHMATPSPVPAILTFIVLGAFVGTLITLFFVGVPVSNRDIVVYMIGQLSGGLTSALAFWLGTTRQSEMKTNMLAQAPALPQR